MAAFALIFDMDGTLVDNNAYHLRAWRAFLARRGVQLTDADYLQRVSGVNSAQTIRRFLGENHSPEDIRTMQQEKESLYRSFAAPHLKPLAGLVPFLEEVRQAHIPMAVATSAPEENIGFTLEGLGIRDYFRVVTGGDEVPRAKPDPAIFLYTAEKLGFPPEKCLVFEDSVSGLEAARAAGMPVVRLATAHRGGELNGASLVIDDYRGLAVSRLCKLLPC